MRRVRSIDAILAQRCPRYELTMLTADKDFARMAEHAALRVWGLKT
jgi:predicted nucleic acid-binding protein